MNKSAKKNSGGRPSLGADKPAGAAKPFYVKMPAELLQLIDDAADACGENRSAWARGVLERAARRAVRE